MMQTYEAVLQPNGQLQFMQEAGPVDTAACGAALSEAALAQDWLRDEEDAAWAHIEPLT